MDSQTFITLSVGPLLSEIFQTSQIGIVHSVFDHACNLQFDHHLVGLLSPIYGNNPYSIRVKAPFSWPIGMCVRWKKDGLYFENGDHIKLDNTPIWAPILQAIHLDTIPLDAIGEQQLFQSLESLIGLGPGLTPSGDDYIVWVLEFLTLLVREAVICLVTLPPLACATVFDFLPKMRLPKLLWSYQNHQIL